MRLQRRRDRLNAVSPQEARRPASMAGALLPLAEPRCLSAAADARRRVKIERKWSSRALLAFFFFATSNDIPKIEQTSSAAN